MNQNIAIFGQFEVKVQLPAGLQESWGLGTVDINCFCELDQTPGQSSGHRDAAALGPCPGMGSPMRGLTRAGCSPLGLSPGAGAAKGHSSLNLFSRRNVNI